MVMIRRSSICYIQQAAQDQSLDVQLWWKLSSGRLDGEPLVQALGVMSIGFLGALTFFN